MLLELLHDYEHLLETFERRWPAFLPGTLQEKEKSGNLYYYRCLRDGNRRLQIPIPANTKNGLHLISLLMEKRVVYHGRFILRKNVCILKKACKALKVYDPEGYFQQHHDMAQHIALTDRLFLPGQLNTTRWINDTLTGNYQTNPFHPEHLLFRTAGNHKVRSKSEVFWADTLSHAQLLYRYECALQLQSGRIIYPDFTVLHPKEHRLIYIEHFGRMDDPQYAMQALRRLQEYADHGLLLGQDVFFTAESQKHPLSKDQINAIIRKIAE